MASVTANVRRAVLSIKVDFAQFALGESAVVFSLSKVTKQNRFLFLLQYNGCKRNSQLYIQPVFLA